MNYQSNPLKLYIQDIYRANRSIDNKFIYELFGLTFKNVMLHGVVTLIYNTTEKTTNFELSDPTGTVQTYFDRTKSNSYLKKDVIQNLKVNFTTASKFGDVNIGTMSWLMDKIMKTNTDFTEGDFVSVIGDIFVDDKGYRMIAAYNCLITNVERDIVWLEELRYIYDKVYLRNKE